MSNSATPLAHIDRIHSAVLIPEQHPEIGRPIGGGSTLRELVISHGKTAYIALYEPARAEGLVRIVDPSPAGGRLPGVLTASAAPARSPGPAVKRRV